MSRSTRRDQDLDVPAAAVRDERAPGRGTLTEDVVRREPVQYKREAGTSEPGDAERIASRGFSGLGSGLPHQDTIQQAFGHHDVSQIDAHVGGEAASASQQLGAVAYAQGDSVAFRSQPDLHTAAHEAAHVVQQRQGVQRYGGGGGSDAGAEKHADAVADQVVAGRSVEGLLDGGPSVVGGVHRKPNDKVGDSLPSLDIKPGTVAFGAVTVGEPLSQVIEITNTGDEHIIVDDLMVFGSNAFQATVLGKNDLGPGQTIWARIGFKPTAPGEQNAMVSILLSSGVGKSFSVKGIATPKPEEQPVPKAGTPAPAHTPAPQPAVTPQPPGAHSPFVVGSQPVMGPQEKPDARNIPQPLQANPPAVHFGTDVKGEVGKLITLTNRGTDLAIIDEVLVNGDKKAFSAELKGGHNLVEAGDSTEIILDYNQSMYGGDGATIDVVLSTGAHLYIPLSGPEAKDLVSPMPSTALEIFPMTVDVGQVPMKSWSGDRTGRITVTNRSRAADRIDVIEMASGPGSPFSIDAPKKEVGPGGTVEWSVRFLPKAMGKASDKAWLMNFSGEMIGWIDVSGEGVEAEANPYDTTAASTKGAEPDVADAPDAPVVIPNDGLDHERMPAMLALSQWDQAATRAIDHSHSHLLGEWIEYLGKTASNPTIPNLPQMGGAALGMLLEKTIGGGAVKTYELLEHKVRHGGHEGGEHGGGEHGGGGHGGGGHDAKHGGGGYGDKPVGPDKGTPHDAHAKVTPPDAHPHAPAPEVKAPHAPAGSSSAGHGVEKAGEKELEKVAAEKAGEKALGKAGTQAAAGATGAEVGALAGPAGAVIGFAIGVLIDFAVGMIFHWLSGEDEEIKEAIKEAWESGFTEGSGKAGALIKSKKGELDGAKAKAQSYQKAKWLAYQTAVMSAHDAGTLGALSDELQGLVVAANLVKPIEGLADQLLVMWLRAHAGSKDVFQEQLKKGAEEMSKKDPKHFTKEGGIKNQPDLFVAQCFQEWETRGLVAPAGLEEQVLSELGMQKGQPVDDPETAKKMANEALLRFGKREFVWRDLSEHADGGFFEEGYGLDFVTCRPDLVIGADGATCLATGFHYTAKSGDDHMTANSVPGDTKLQNKKVSQGPGQPAAHEVSQELYGTMQKLEAQGLTVVQGPNAGDDPSIKGLAPDAAIPRSQSATGQEQVVSVFRVTEPIQKMKDGVTIPDDVTGVTPQLWAEIFGHEVMRMGGDRSAVRAGDTILVVTAKIPKDD